LPGAQQQYIYPQDGGFYSPYSQQGAISFASSSGAMHMSSAPMQVQRDYIDLKDGIQVDCGNGVQIEKTHTGALKKLKKSKPSAAVDADTKKSMKMASPEEILSHVQSNLLDLGFESLQSHKPKSLKKAPVANPGMQKTSPSPIADNKEISNRLKELQKGLKTMETLKKDMEDKTSIFKATGKPSKVGENKKAKSINRINMTSF